MFPRGVWPVKVGALVPSAGAEVEAGHSASAAMEAADARRSIPRE